MPVAIRTTLVAALLLLVAAPTASAAFAPGDTFDAGAASAPSLAVTPSSDKGALAWVRHVPGNTPTTQVVMAGRTPGGSFHVNVVLPEGTAAPTVGVDAAGNMTVAYLVGAGASRAVEATTLPAAGGPPVTSPLASAVDDVVPEVAVGPNGHATVVYQRDGILRARTRATLGETYAGEVDLSPAGATEPAAAAGADGTVSVAWVEGTGTSRTVRARTWPAGASGFEPAQTVAAPDPGNGVFGAFEPSVAVSPTGTTVIALRQLHGVERIRRAVRPAGAAQAWTAAAEISSPAADAWYPVVAIDGAGVDTIAWLDRGASPGQDTIRARTAGTSELEQLSAQGVNFATRPALSVNADGNAVAAWVRAGRVEAATRPAATGDWGTAEVVSPAGEAPEAVVAGIAADGLANVAWQGGATPGTIRTTSGSSVPPPAVAFSTASPSLSEGPASDGVTLVRPAGGGEATVLLRRTGGTAGPDDVTVPATSGVVEEPNGWTVTIPAGATQKLVPLTVNDDATDEDDETLELVIQEPTGDAAIGSPASATAVIADDDAAPSISVADAQVVEGNAASEGVHLLLTVTLSGPSGRPVRFGYAATAGSAGAADFEAIPADYVETIDPGVTSTQIGVAIKEDTVDEPDETLTVTLEDLEHATAGDVQAVGTIKDDDAPPASGGNAPPASGGGGVGADRPALADPKLVDIVDTTGPKVSVVEEPHNISTPVMVRFSADEPATFTCQVDAGPVRSCVSPANLGSLTLGHKDLKIVARDAFGNASVTTHRLRLLYDVTGFLARQHEEAQRIRDSLLAIVEIIKAFVQAWGNASELAKAKAAPVPFDVKQPGKATVVVTAPAARGGTTRAVAAARKQVVVLSGRKVFKKKGLGRITLRLTPAGRKLLNNAQGQVKLTIASSFDPKGKARRKTRRATVRLPAR